MGQCRFLFILFFCLFRRTFAGRGQTPESIKTRGFRGGLLRFVKFHFDDKGDLSPEPIMLYYNIMIRFYGRALCKLWTLSVERFNGSRSISLLAVNYVVQCIILL